MDTNTQKTNCHLRTTVRRIIFLAGVFYLTFFFAPFLNEVHASTAGDTAIQGTQMLQQDLGLAGTDIRIIIARIIRIALGFLGIIFLVLVLYGGYLWMTAAGNDNQISDAKKIIFNGSIGIMIILSSFAIVSFVMRMLGLEGGDGNTDVNTLGMVAVEQNFYGSGALGSAIRDHYPIRGQTNVPRNTRVLITFRRAVLPQSFIDDVNNNGIFGDCRNNSPLNWETDCDRLRISADRINIVGRDGTPIRGGSALVSLENGRAYTVSIRPYDYLGSDSENQQYTVRVGREVLNDDEANNNPSVFANRPAGSDFYEWQFITGTELDLTPPVVLNVYPENNSTSNRNSVIQINFSKPMDPMGLQGEFNPVNDFYTISSWRYVYLRSGSSTVPAGTFKLVNNYQTLEFTPSAVCGQNSCGGTVYCLPVCNEPGASCNVDNYEVILRTAMTVSTSTFEALPYTGIADVNGNALDGDRDRRVDPVISSWDIFNTLRVADNYFWRFNVSNQLDVTAPYIRSVTPGPDATYIQPNEELSMVFTKRMRADSLYNITIEEQPVKTEPVCRRPVYTYDVASDTSNVRLEHCPFLNNQRNYYYPVVDSTVEDVNFNCFYPGMGPVGRDAATNASLVCDGQNNCCQVDQGDAFCCNGLTDQGSRETCLNYLRGTSPL